MTTPLEDAIGTVIEIGQQRGALPEDPLLFLAKGPELAADLLRRGLEISGEPWWPPGLEGTGRPGTPEPLNLYANVDFCWRTDGDELVAYQRREKRGGGHTMPEREWRNLGVKESPEQVSAIVFGEAKDRPKALRVALDNELQETRNAPAVKHEPPLSATKRQERSQNKQSLYSKWRELADQFRSGHGDKRRTRGEIARLIAKDPAAIDPSTNRTPAASSVRRRLDQHFPGWAEKS